MALAVLRLLVVLAGAVGGATLGPAAGASAVAGGVVGAVAAAIAVALETAAGAAPIGPLAGGAAGAGGGLLVGLALGVAVGPLAGPAEAAVRAGAALLGAWMGGAVGARRWGDLPALGGGARAGTTSLLDTSVIVDGRIADVVAAGFLGGTLLVPRFVLRELQQLADGGDATRRNRGRRGFEVLERLQRHPAVRVEITDADVPGVAEVDGKLVALAGRRRARLLTNDTALARMAALAGVTVASIHELASAVRPAVLPGEPLQVQLVREGKEPGQGVGYLDDGTLVVVEGGKRWLGQTVDIIVTSVLPTSAGRMIFGRPRGEEPGSGGRGA